MTLTHCRFEARAIHGIKRVIVSDFDEFLYCPAAKSHKPQDQSSYIRSTMEMLTDGGVDQVTFRQFTMLNKTDVPADCVVEQVALRRSPLECYASANFTAGGHSIKSVHLSHVCPLTGYHEACSSSYNSATHNCLCNSQSVVGQCYFLHAVTNIKTYIHSYTHQRYVKHVIPEEARNSKSEIMSFLERRS